MAYRSIIFTKERDVSVDQNSRHFVAYGNRQKYHLTSPTPSYCRSTSKYRVFSRRQREALPACFHRARRPWASIVVPW